MLEYLIKRLLLALLTLFVIMFISYALVRCAPGDPTRSSIFGGDSAGGDGLSTGKNILAVNKSLREKLHLDKPMLVGFSYWLKNAVLKGDLGESASFDKGRPVGKIIMDRLPVTLTLNILSIFVIYFLAIPLGIHSAVTHRKKLDRLATFLLLLLYSLPSFWVALLLQAGFCEGGRWAVFPLKGIVPESTVGFGTFEILVETAKHYMIPVFCLSYAGFAGLSRYARTGMLEVIKQDYIRTARAKGLHENVVILKHAFRNSLITLITLFAGLLPGLVAGSIIIEHVFSIPGMGSLSIQALSSRDIPLIMALFGFGGALTLLGIIAADFMYVLADPRITFEKR